MSPKFIKHYYLFVSCVISLTFWFFDSIVHNVIYEEFRFEVIPSDFNELWMRTLIVILLVTFGKFADYKSRIIAKKEEEKQEIYEAMLRANHHILNNFLNNMLFFYHEAADSKKFNSQTIDLLDAVIEEAKERIRLMDNIHQPNKNAIEERYQCNSTQDFSSQKIIDSCQCPASSELGSHAGLEH